MSELIFSTLEAACDAVGVVPSETRSGQWVKADIENDRHGRGDARIKAFQDGSGGVVVNWKTDSRAFWFYDYGRRMSREERDRLRRHVMEARAQAEAEARRRADLAAAVACTILRAARHVEGHAYLSRKRVRPSDGYAVMDAQEANAILEPDGLGRLFNPKSHSLMRGPVLCIPMRAWVGGRLIIRGVQFIAEDGGKTFMRGARAKGAFWLPRGIPSAPTGGSGLIGVAEGVVTAQSVEQVKGFPVIAALSSGNLESVAGTVRAMYPQYEVIVLGDQGRGAEQARKAAEVIGAYCAIPTFDDELIARFRERTGQAEASPTDFNDYFIATGEL